MDILSLSEQKGRASDEITRWQARNQTKEGSVFFTPHLAVELIATAHCSHKCIGEFKKYSDKLMLKEKYHQGILQQKCCCSSGSA